MLLNTKTEYSLELSHTEVDNLRQILVYFSNNADAFIELCEFADDLHSEIEDVV